MCGIEPTPLSLWVILRDVMLPATATVQSSSLRTGNGRQPLNDPNVSGETE